MTAVTSIIRADMALSQARVCHVEHWTSSRQDVKMFPQRTHRNAGYRRIAAEECRLNQFFPEAHITAWRRGADQSCSAISASELWWCGVCRCIPGPSRIIVPDSHAHQIRRVTHTPKFPSNRSSRVDGLIVQDGAGRNCGYSFLRITGWHTRRWQTIPYR